MLRGLTQSWIAAPPIGTAHPQCGLASRLALRWNAKGFCFGKPGGICAAISARSSTETYPGKEPGWCFPSGPTTKMGSGHVSPLLKPALYFFVRYLMALFLPAVGAYFHICAQLCGGDLLETSSPQRPGLSARVLKGLQSATRLLCGPSERRNGGKWWLQLPTTWDNRIYPSFALPPVLDVSVPISEWRHGTARVVVWRIGEARGQQRLV